MFRASCAHLQDDTVVYMQHIVLSLSIRVPGGLTVYSSRCVPSGHQELTVPHAACIQLYSPEDEHLRLETCREE